MSTRSSGSVWISDSLAILETLATRACGGRRLGERGAAPPLPPSQPAGLRLDRGEVGGTQPGLPPNGAYPVSREAHVLMGVALGSLSLDRLSQ